jgi:hypothetical protein
VLLPRSRSARTGVRMVGREAAGDGGIRPDACSVTRRAFERRALSAPGDLAGAHLWVAGWRRGVSGSDG